MPTGNVLHYHAYWKCIAPGNLFNLNLSFHRYPEPNDHGFILEFLLSEAFFYAKINKQVKYILDIMKLDVPNLFTGPPSNPGIPSIPGAKFKEHLHSYIATNDLPRELLKNVDVIMVSPCPSFCLLSFTIFMCSHFRIEYIPPLMVFKTIFCLYCKR